MVTIHGKNPTTTVDFPANISTINVWHYNFQRENAFVSSARSDQPLQ